MPLNSNHSITSRETLIILLYNFHVTDLPNPEFGFVPKQCRAMLFTENAL